MKMRTHELLAGAVVVTVILVAVGCLIWGLPVAHARHVRHMLLEDVCAAILDDSIESRLFALGARPHVFYVSTDGSTPGKPHWDNLGWLLEPENLARLKRDDFGHVIFWEYLYTARATPQDGHYEYKCPERVAVAMQAVRLIGCKVIGYIHGGKWRAGGLTPFDALDEIERHGWDGVLLDNGQVGGTIQETHDFFIRLKRAGLVVMHHNDVVPHYGVVPYVGPWADLVDYTLRGEIVQAPKTLVDPMWWRQIGQAGRSNTIGIYMLGKRPDNRQWRGRQAEYYPKLPEWRCVARAQPSDLDVFEAHFLPAQRRAAEAWRSR